MIKTFISLLSLSVVLFASNSFSIEPVGKTQLRFEDKSKKYNSLGKLVNKEEKLQLNDYIFGGSFGLKSIFNNYELNALLYGVARLKPKDENPLKNEKSFYNNDSHSFLFLGELNLKKSFDNHTITIGRQKYKTHLVYDNYRITNNSYEGLRYDYVYNDFTFQTLYFNKIASSTLANNIPYNHKYGFIGYGLGYNTGQFVDVSQHIMNKDLSTNGVLHFLAKYGDKDNYISFENLFADNFFNTSSLNFAYRLDNFYLKTGALYQTSIGKNHIENHIENSQQGKKLKSSHYQVQLKYQKKKLRLEYKLTYTPYHESSIYNGTLYSPFSNNTSYLRGLHTAHAIIADTKSQKFSVTDLIKLHKVPVVLSVAYVAYAIGEKNGLSPTSLDTTEIYLHAKGYFSKHLSAKIQYSHIKNFDPLTAKTNTIYTVIEYNF